MQTNGTTLTTGENESMVLEEEIDENYEPTQEEILEYSQYIGLDPEADKDLLYLAKEGLKAPLPSDWKPCQNREGKIYYFNFKTKQSQWEHPCDEYYKKICQEMKRKKEEKPATKSAKNKPEKNNTQNAFNMPFAKQDSLPIVKKNAVPQQSYNQSLEASFSADNQLFTMNHKMSFSNDNQENNSITDKKFDGKVLPADFESFQSLASENAFINSQDSQEDSEEKTNEHRSKGQSEIDKLVKMHKEAESKLERQLKQKMERELQELKNELSSSSKQGSSAEFIKEKETIKSNMKNEYKKKADTAIQKLENEYAVKKKEVETSEAKKLSENRQADEEKIKEEFEAKQAALLEEKKKLELERERVRIKEQSQKMRLEEEFEREKKEITEDYAGLIREAEAEELFSQKQEIENYKKELQNKLVEEKKTLVLAKKQKESINLTRKSELNDLYARRLKLEQEKIDTEMVKCLKEYEDSQRRKKDEEIVKLQNMELAHERERNQMNLQEELDQLQAGYTDRLINYQKILKDKFKKEKSALDREVTKTIEEYKKNVDIIKVNASTKEDIFSQINRANVFTKDARKDIADLEDKIEAQQEENRHLKLKVESLRNDERARQDESNKYIEELKKKIKDAENQVVKLTQKNERRNEMPRQRPKSMQTIPKPIVKSNSVLGAIKKDVKDIKAFLTKRDSVPRTSRRNGHETTRLSETSRRESPVRGSVSRFEDYSHARTHRDWSELVNDEENRIQVQKQELEGEKRALKKDRETIATHRESYKSEHPALLSIDGQDTECYRKEVRKRKNSLNTQIYQLNSNITRLRGDEALLKNKEKSFRYLKDAVEKFENEEIGPEELEAIYQNYQETDILLKPNTENRSKSSFNKENRGSILSNRKSKKFFQNWRDSMNGQPTDDSDLESNRTREERGTVSYRAYGKENIRSGNVSREKISRSRPGSYKPGADGGYSYNSLIDVLEMKTKQETRVSTSSFIHTEATGIRETRVQATNFFSQHSQWLKDMKNQLNKQLYERPTRGPAFFMK